MSGEEIRRYEWRSRLRRTLVRPILPLPLLHPNINPPFSAPSSTDELFKSSVYLTEAYVLNDATKYSTQPTETPFNFAFGTKKGFFGWLEEGEGARCEEGVWLKGSRGEGGVVGVGRGNKFRLERFGKAMSGSCAWDPPGGLLNGSSPPSPSLSPKTDSSSKQRA
jgi:hypothetical protein